MSKLCVHFRFVASPWYPPLSFEGLNNACPPRKPGRLLDEVFFVLISLSGKIIWVYNFDKIPADTFID